MILRREFCLKFNALWLVLYSLLVEYFFFPALKLAAFVSDHVKKQVEGRREIVSSNVLLEFAARRRKYRSCVLFFCSSAGEYEQAKPVISRLNKEGVFSHVFFFSRSGFDFAVARHETASYSLSPLDSWFMWGEIFAAFRPNLCVVVRHEFWPGFFAASKRWCPVYILDAVPPSMLGRESPIKTNLSKRWKRWLFRFADVRVFAVDSAGVEYFTDVLKVSSDQVPQIGDTKYDRVLERIHDMAERAQKRADAIRVTWSSKQGDLPILVLGSAHLPDVELVLRALREDVGFRIRLVIVPHNLSSTNIASISTLLRNFDLSQEMIGDVELLILDGKKLDSDVILVDTLGHLSELYAVADIAFVGGAVHAKIHNVLEPAGWGVPLTSGPRFHNSQEAVSLVNRGLLVPADDPKVLCSVWQKQLRERSRWSHDINQEMIRLAGASDKFLQIIQDKL